MSFQRAIRSSVGMATEDDSSDLEFPARRIVPMRIGSTNEIVLAIDALIKGNLVIYSS